MIEQDLGLIRKEWEILYWRMVRVIANVTDADDTWKEENLKKLDEYYGTIDKAILHWMNYENRNTEQV